MTTVVFVAFAVLAIAFAGFLGVLARYLWRTMPPRRQTENPVQGAAQPTAGGQQNTARSRFGMGFWLFLSAALGLIGAYAMPRLWPKDIWPYQGWIVGGVFFLVAALARYFYSRYEYHKQQGGGWKEVSKELWEPVTTEDGKKTYRRISGLFVAIAFPLTFFVGLFGYLTPLYPHIALAFFVALWFFIATERAAKILETIASVLGWIDCILLVGGSIYVTLLLFYNERLAAHPVALFVNAVVLWRLGRFLLKRKDADGNTVQSGWRAGLACVVLAGVFGMMLLTDFTSLLDGPLAKLRDGIRAYQKEGTIPEGIRVLPPCWGNKPPKDETKPDAGKPRDAAQATAPAPQPSAPSVPTATETTPARTEVVHRHIHEYVNPSAREERQPVERTASPSAAVAASQVRDDWRISEKLRVMQDASSGSALSRRHWADRAAEKIEKDIPAGGALQNFLNPARRYESPEERVRRTLGQRSQPK